MAHIALILAQCPQGLGTKLQNGAKQLNLTYNSWLAKALGHSHVTCGSGLMMGTLILKKERYEASSPSL